MNGMLLINIFKPSLPVHNFAISVEANFISCGDLFIQFLMTISKLEEIENSNDFVPILKLHITKRLNESIKENEAFLASLFLDPRVNNNSNIFLSSSELANKAQVQGCPQKPEEDPAKSIKICPSRKNNFIKNARKSMNGFTVAYKSIETIQKQLG